MLYPQYVANNLQPYNSYPLQYPHETYDPSAYHYPANPDYNNYAYRPHHGMYPGNAMGMYQHQPYGYINYADGQVVESSGNVADNELTPSSLEVNNDTGQSIEQEHVDQGYLEQEHVDQGYLEHEHVDQGYLEHEHVDQAHLEQEHVDQAHLEQEHVDQAHLEQEHVDQCHLEQDIEKQKASLTNVDELLSLSELNLSDKKFHSSYKDKVKVGLTLKVYVENNGVAIAAEKQ
jgi:hypothetical protein